MTQQGLQPQPEPKPPLPARPQVPARIARAAAESNPQDLTLVHLERDAGDGHEITPTHEKALVMWAAGYNLDPYQGHVCFMYGEPYITERGAVVNASRYPEYDGYTLTRLSDAEKLLQGFDAEAFVARCEVYVKGRTYPVVDFGEVLREEREELERKTLSNLQRDPRWANSALELQNREVHRRLLNLPLYTFPGKLAQARAIRRAHLLAFPLRTREELPHAGG